MTTVLHTFDAEIAPEALMVMRETMRIQLHAGLSPIPVRIGGDAGRADLPPARLSVRQSGPWPSTAAAPLADLASKLGAAALHAWSCGALLACSGTGVMTVGTLLRPPVGQALKAVRLAVQNDARLATGSETLRHHLVETGLPTDRVEVHSPHAFEPTPPRDDPAIVRERFGLEPDGFLAVTTALYEEDRGPYWSAWGGGILQYLREPVQVAVMGQGHATQRAEFMARQGNLMDVARFVGPTKDCADLWAAADVVITYDDAGFGLAAVLTAAAAGVPVIAADAGEMPELVGARRVGLLAEPRSPRSLAKAMLILHEQPSIRHELAVNIRRSFGRQKEQPPDFDSLYGSRQSASKND